MRKIILENRSKDGSLLQATFLPEKGMNLISCKKNDIEIIEQSTWSLFEERFAGLGALIGPHFHHRRPELIPLIENENLFPHIARVKSKGVLEPFSHGIARYAPWNAEATKTHVKAMLTGKDLWRGISLAELEGQNFEMNFRADLKEEGLFLNLSVVSDAASVVGIHYYYALPNGKGKVTSQVKDKVIIDGILQDIPKEWDFNHQHFLSFDLDRGADFTFRPYPNSLSGSILLETEKYQLHTGYSCNCEENSWQLYHPKSAPFVCIEPISAQDPRHPDSSVSSLSIHLEIA